MNIPEPLWRPHPHRGSDLERASIPTTALVASLPLGKLGYAEVTANQGSITSETDLTGLSVTVTVGTGRRIKITGYVQWTNSGTTGTAVLRIKEGTTQLQPNQVNVNTIGGNGMGSQAVVILAPSAGSHTYKLTGQHTIGTGTLSAGSDFPAFILVEDVGAA